MKTVLVIAYKFPPYVGIGGYRWQKAVKYLSQMNIKIHVITVSWPGMENADGVKDVTNKNVVIHRIPSGYPDCLVKINQIKNRYIRAFLSRIRWLIHQWVYFDDEAQRWGKYLLPFSGKLIENESIKTVFVTGAPFQSNRWGLEIKKKHPNIQLVQDLRDPWSRDPMPFNKPLFKFQQRLREKWESLVISESDHIVVVSEGMKDHFCEKVTPKNISVICNGVDIQEKKETAYKKEYDLIYAGNLNCGRDIVLKKMLKALQKAKLYLKICIAGKCSESFISECNDLYSAGELSFFGFITQQQVFNLIKKSKSGLQINAQAYPYALSTKLFEYPAHNVPVLSLNYGGDIERIIHKYKMGTSININHTDNLQSSLMQFFNNMPDHFTCDVSSFSHKAMSEKFASLIK